MPPKLPRRVVGAIDRLRADTWNRLLDCVEYAMHHPNPDGRTTRLTEAGELAVMRPANAAAVPANAPAASGYNGPSAVSFDKKTRTVYIAAGYALYHWDCYELSACSFVYLHSGTWFWVKLYITPKPANSGFNVVAGDDHTSGPEGANNLNCEIVTLAKVDTSTGVVTQLRYGAIDIRWRT